VIFERLLTGKPAGVERRVHALQLLVAGIDRQVDGLKAGEYRDLSQLHAEWLKVLKTLLELLPGLVTRASQRTRRQDRYVGLGDTLRHEITAKTVQEAGQGIRKVRN
jgi:hypothetical protein